MRGAYPVIAVSALLICLLAFSGCASNAQSNGAAAATATNVSYTSGNFTVNGIICTPANATTYGIVLTGGDGVTLEKLRQPCEAFARQGIAALAHENVNGTIGDNIGAVIDGVEYLRATLPSLHSISLWAHSSGTILSILAAYNLNISSFIETSGHFQIPLCDRGNIFAQNCIAYLDDFPAPIMIVHGGADSVVNVSFAYAFEKRLSADGIPHAQIIVPGGAHEFFTDREDVVAKEAEFVKNPPKK